MPSVHASPMPCLAHAMPSDARHATLMVLPAAQCLPCQCRAHAAPMQCNATPHPCHDLHCLQTDLVLGVLAALPPGLTSLQLAMPCAGPVLGVIGERFTRLQRLALPCNSAEIIWKARGTAAALPLLEELSFDYWPPKYYLVDGFLDRNHEPVAIPDSVAAVLQGATRLHSLALVLRFSPAVGTLWVSLPALRSLKCVGKACKEASRLSVVCAAVTFPLPAG